MKKLHWDVALQHEATLLPSKSSNARVTTASTLKRSSSQAFSSALDHMRAALRAKSPGSCRSQGIKKVGKRRADGWEVKDPKLKQFANRVTNLGSGDGEISITYIQQVKAIDESTIKFPNPRPIPRNAGSTH